MNSKTDVTKSYIDWAVKNDFSVVDVNIPLIVAVEDEEVGYFSPDNTTKADHAQSNLGYTMADDQKVRSDRTRMMANYLWVNYIESVNLIATRLITDSYAGLVTQHKSSSWE